MINKFDHVKKYVVKIPEQINIQMINQDNIYNLYLYYKKSPKNGEHEKTKMGKSHVQGVKEK